VGVEVTHAHAHTHATYIHIQPTPKVRRERIRIPQLPQVPSARPGSRVEDARTARVAVASRSIVGASTISTRLRAEVSRETQPWVESELEEGNLVAAGG